MSREDEVRATCHECGMAGTLRALRLHSCDIQKNGGVCEDYPCCGHEWGECQNRPEFTGEYWQGIMNDPMTAPMAYEPGSPEWYDAVEALEERMGS